MLQGVEPVVGEFGDLFTRRPDAEYATFFTGFWIGLRAGHDRATPRDCG
ncbi:amidophosphoribosyltransferase domain protein [Mycolicibacterium hassiacum DSM 44199]|uniref:Amidophosphoribosyltransferase domain protein n=1 Tax=Mycolicibacterium hassiacum (strain DSM 44199 / CIP 105218 / JCM 12690 / 3849) TaxID=1122247 RepID=K5BEF8_MYCHD|nr:amidophosphoribosyltransferase domain protein [Mycolicibacterium hassiacum DSM 44199]